MRRTGMVFAFILLCALRVSAQQISVISVEGNVFLTPGAFFRATGLNWLEFRANAPSSYAQGFNAVQVVTPEAYYECRVYRVTADALDFVIPAYPNPLSTIGLQFNGDKEFHLVVRAAAPSLPRLSGANIVEGVYFIGPEVKTINDGVVTRPPGTIPVVSLFGSGFGTSGAPLTVVLEGATMTQITASSYGAANPFGANEAISFELSPSISAGIYTVYIRNTMGLESNRLLMAVADVVIVPVTVETPRFRRRKR